MIKSGIYKITNTINNKCYIGQSVDIDRRIKQHKKDLKANHRENSRLINSYNKYGIGAFKFETVLLCDKESLTLYEDLIINFYKSNDKRYGFNIRLASDSNLGIRRKSKIFYPGQKYGRLTLLNSSTSNGKDWEVICDCGIKKTVNIASVKYGKIQSCGCIKKEILKNRSKYNKGDKFNRLTLSHIVSQTKHKQNNWLCICDCGQEKIISISAIVQGNTKSCGCLRKELDNKRRKK